MFKKHVFEKRVIEVSSLEEQLLNSAQHDRKTFTCGVKELDDYLHLFAIQQSKKGIAAVRVLIDITKPKFILGYYSLSAAQINVSQMDEHIQKKLPRYPLPCFRLGRLAIHSSHQGCGIGSVLMGCVIERCLEAKKSVAAYAIVVDAKGKKAQSFYQHYGFISCCDNPMTLYLPIRN